MDAASLHTESPPLDRAVELVLLGAALAELELAAGMSVLALGSTAAHHGDQLLDLDVRPIIAIPHAGELTAVRDRLRSHPSGNDAWYVEVTGRRLGLDESSVDRVLVLDSEIDGGSWSPLLPEFVRILRPGGIAALAERFDPSLAIAPGDVIGERWRAAQDAGFADLRVGLHAPLPHLVGVAEYETAMGIGAVGSSLGPTGQAWQQEHALLFLRS